MRQRPLPPSPLYFSLPLDFKACRFSGFVSTVTASLFRSLFHWGEFCWLFSFPKQVTELVVASQPSFSLSRSGHRHTLPETDTPTRRQPPEIPPPPRVQAASLTPPGQQAGPPGQCARPRGRCEAREVFGFVRG